MLTIFLDQEILFSISGFNGDIYSNIASDIIKFANEINNKTLRARGKAFIELRFLEETRRSVKNFFSATEHSLRNNTVLDPDAIAMRIILENCESPADVKQKEINFFKGLEDLGIFVEDEIEYYSAENMIYNSISAELCQAISKDLNIKEDDIAFEVLNMISIRRKANMSQSLFESKYVLLTENSNRHRIARSELISSSKNFPLTINTDLFVIHAWLMLNKGFSLNEHPASFDVVLKAQITLSSRLSKNVRYDYDKLKIAFDNGEMSREEATQNIVHLRNLAVLPEQISENNLNDIFEGISNSEIASAKEIMDRKDIEIKKAKEELVRLSKVTNEYEKRAEIKINSQEEKILELSSKLDEVSRKLLENDHAKKVEESNKTRKKKKRELIIQVIAVVILSGVIAYFIVTNSLVNYMAASFGVIVTLFIGVTSIFKLISTYYKKYSNLSNSEEI